MFSSLNLEEQSDLSETCVIEFQTLKKPNALNFADIEEVCIVKIVLRYLLLGPV